jgi:hypothetical protein
MGGITKLALILSVASAFLFPHSKINQRKKEVDLSRLERLSPAAFPQLPKNLVRRLQARRCTIPQADLEPKPNNVIPGQFIRKGQADWAVLCSRGGRSSILVFWGDSKKSPVALAKASDDAYWLGNAGEGFHYYRHLMTADKKYILIHYREYGREQPIPPINHDGIDDGFLEKGSEVYYYYRGKWWTLPGAD